MLTIEVNRMSFKYAVLKKAGHSGGSQKALKAFYVYRPRKWIRLLTVGCFCCRK